MRTNIEIDDTLLTEAMAILGETTKRGTVEAALRRIIRLDGQRKALDELRGIGWDGDLEKMRTGE
jgi:Arc/MetJ family transcription regulator